MIFVIVKDNYVIDRIVADADFVYPHPHDLMVEDVDMNIYIGDWYEGSEDIFYRPITGTPPDFPTELQPITPPNNGE
jgi:hypothetical protein